MQARWSARAASFALDALEQAARWSWALPLSAVMLLLRHGGVSLFAEGCTDHGASIRPRRQ